jgi:hypothetical protein
MGRESREVWEKRVARWRDSGLSAREFAAEVGVNAGTLGWWSSRLRRGEPAEAPTGRRRSRRDRAEPAASAASTTAPVKWLEVVGEEEQFAERGSAAAPMPVFELVVAGRTIRVPVGFDADSLRRLITVVETR